MKTSEQESAMNVAKSIINRRSFVRSVGFTGLGLAGAAIIGEKFGVNEQKVQAASYSDIDILNFALNLEYLEAEYYSKSTYGATLLELGVLKADDQSGPTNGGSMIPNFAASPFAYAATGIRNDEIHHVQLLRSVLGSTAVKKPTINLDAMGYGFASVDQFYKLGSQLEDTGLSAYLGAAPLIATSPYLATAAQIIGTEGQHEASLRTAAIMNGVTVPALDSLDVPPTHATPFFVNTKTGLSIPRTTTQVLNIVYAGGKCSGGFFPDGMNGIITCQS